MPSRLGVSAVAFFAHITLFSREAAAVRAAVALPKWKSCRLFGGKTVKKYHFEYITEEGDHTALLFIRDPVSPKLVIYPQASWIVSLSNEMCHCTKPVMRGSEESATVQTNPYCHVPDGLTWGLQRQTRSNMSELVASSKPSFADWVAVAPPERDENFAYQTIDLKTVRNIRFVEESLSNAHTNYAMEIKLMNGTVETIGGGMFFPHQLLTNYLKNLCWETRNRPLVAPGQFVPLGWRTVASLALRKIVGQGSGTVVGFSTFGGGIAGVGSAIFLMPLLFGVITAMPVVLPAVLLGGLIGGSALGAGVSGSRMGYQVAKYKQELGSVPGKKVFEKLRCHKGFRLCSSEILVPTAKGCASLVR
jgi:hypothetical protein